MTPLRALLLLLCLAITPLSRADERLMVQTGREVFGLFPTATPAAFIRASCWCVSSPRALT